MLGLGFNALGNHLQAHAAPQCNHHAGNAGVVRVGQHVAHK